MKVSRFLVRAKYRFDIGRGFLTIANFAFIVLAASDKITSLVHLPAKVLVPLLVPLALFAVWFIGSILDKMQFMEAYQEESNRRNEMLSAVHTSVNAKMEQKDGQDRL